MTTPTQDASATIRDPLPDHPLLQGKPELARGRHSIVLDAGNERVYKIITDPDVFQLYAAEDRPQGVHFPIIHAYHGIIGRTGQGLPMHLFEMERLYPIPARTPAGELAARLTQVYWEMCQQWGELGWRMGRLALKQMTQLQPPLVQGTLAEAIEALAQFAEQYKLLPDLISRDNLMMRRDGTLVFSSPIAHRD